MQVDSDESEELLSGCALEELVLLVQEEELVERLWKKLADGGWSQLKECFDEGVGGSPPCSGPESELEIPMDVDADEDLPNTPARTPTCTPKLLTLTLPQLTTALIMRHRYRDRDRERERDKEPSPRLPQPRVRSPLLNSNVLGPQDRLSTSYEQPVGGSR